MIVFIGTNNACLETSLLHGFLQDLLTAGSRVTLFTYQNYLGDIQYLENMDPYQKHPSKPEQNCH